MHPAVDETELLDCAKHHGIVYQAINLKTDSI